MAKTNTGSYWVDKAITCNGCKYLNFYRHGCRRNQKPGEVRILNTYKNGDDYVAVLKPSDCDYVRPQKTAPADQPAEATDPVQAETSAA